MPQTIVHDITMNYEVHLGMAPVDTLFIHGNLGSNRWWYPSLEIWKSQPQGQGRMILAEWRGCGQSGAPASEAELHPEKPWERHAISAFSSRQYDRDKSVPGLVRLPKQPSYSG